MRQINKFDQLSGETKRITLIKIVETDREGKKYPIEMNLRNALQAMRVQPDRFKLADGEKLPKGITVDMVPFGTTITDVREFEKLKGTVGKVTKTRYDNILDAIERGVEIQDVEVQDANPGAEVGSMMSEEAPKDYKPEKVDLEPAEGMKDPNTKTHEEEVFDNKVKEEPKLEELKEKELKFEKDAVATEKYTKQMIKDYPKDKLQAILVGLPAYKTMAPKMQQTILKAKKNPLIDTIVQLSKKKISDGKIK